MKILEINRLRKSVVVYIVVTMLLLSIVAISSVLINAQQVQEKKKNIYSKQINSSMKHVVKHLVQDYTYRIRAILKTTNLATLLEKRDREALYKLLKPKFDAIKEEHHNLRVMHLHLADGSSFLRVHQPEFYGDNTAKDRAMLKDIHKNHKTITGYESGKHTTVYRIITPIFNQGGEYIGAFEVGLKPSFIVDAIYEINGFYGLMFIKESTSLDKATLNTYSLQTTLNENLKNIYAQFSKSNGLSKSIEIEVEDKKYLTHLLLLQDFSAKESVKIIFFQDITNIGSFITNSMYKIYILIFTVLLISAFLIYRRITIYQDSVNLLYLEQLKKIKESEKRYLTEKNNLNSIFAAMEDGVYVVNEEFDIEYVNRVLTKDFGQYEGRKCYEYFHGRSEVCDLCKNSEVHAGKTVRWEWKSEINGKTYDLLDTPLYNADGTISKLELFRDITLNKEMKEQLEFKKKYLQSVFDVIPQIMITTTGVEIDRVNLAMLQFFGYESVEKFKGEHECICDYFIEENEYISAEVDGIHWLEYILKNQDKLHKICMKKDDKKYYFVVDAHKLELDEKERSVVTFSDVSEVEELGARLEIAVNGTNDGLWDWNLETGELYFSPQWKRQLGYEDDELENSMRTWEIHVHPDDRENAVKDYQANIAGKTKVYENIHRLRHKDGSWVWILDRGKTIFEDTKAMRMVGFHTDITEQKELELQLIENEKLYYDFFENTKSANIMYSTDDNGKTFKIKALNSLVEELENVKREDIIGKRVDEVFEGIEEFGLLDTFKEVYASGKAKKTPIALYDDGERKGWRENYVFKLSNGDIVASYEDRTQEKKLDLLLTNTLNSVNNLIFVKDNDLKYLECNSAFEFFLGLSRKDILGKSDYDLFEKDVADFFREKDEEMLASKKMRYNYEWVSYPDGSKRYLLTVKSPLRDDKNNILGLVGNSIDMTRHKQLEDELKDSQEQFEQFMEFIPANIIIIKKSGLIVYANSNANNYFQFDSIEGKMAEELFPQDKAKELQDFERKAYKNGFHEEVLEIVNAQNEVNIYRNMAFVISDEIEKKLGIVSIDITKEYNANREVARVLSAFERSAISVVITDLLGNISYVNPSWCRATGYTKEELIGQNPRIVKSGSVTPESYEKMWKELTSGRVWTSELKNHAKDGSEFWEDSTIMPSFDSSGAVDGYMAFKLDITDKMHLREELRNQEELMIAQSRHAAMGEMISMIAHQWRQPISVIAMDANNILADIELDILDDENLTLCSKDIIRQTQELSKTIDDFRNFFRPEKVAQKVYLSDVLNDALGIIGKSLENNNINCSLDIDENLQLIIYSRELMQVLVNILKNAKEALVEQNKEDKKIKISIQKSIKFVLLEICNNAGSIDKKIMKKIFDPYFSTKGEKNGTGLGLYMSRTIIQKHMQGTLEVHNIEKGVCFTIKLPLGTDAGELRDE